MLTLIIGGAGSGKSAFAEKLIQCFPGERIYLATMEVLDTECRERIERHRAQRRGLGFTTLERPIDLAGAVIPRNANVLLEDLPNLLANELYSPQGGGVEAVERGVQSLCAAAGHLTVVTGELCAGGRDYDKETLAYLQTLARLNRALAARAECAVEVVCGLPNVLKGELPW